MILKGTSGNTVMIKSDGKDNRASSLPKLTPATKNYIESYGKGDNLWKIASVHLNNPFKYRDTEIDKTNKTTSPNLMQPDQVTSSRTE